MRFDAAILINVIYALRSPQSCFRSLFSALKPGGVIGVSIPHKDSDYGPLMDALNSLARTRALADRVQRMITANDRLIKQARSRSLEEYLAGLRTTGFDLICEPFCAYMNAVHVVHARKPH